MSDDSSPDKDEIEVDEDQDVAIEDQVSSSQSSIMSGEQLDFSFEAYDQDICILGSKGSGKSYLANAILKSLRGISVWVYDFNSEFHSSKAILVHELDELLELYDGAKRGHYILQPHNNSEETFRRFNAEAFKRGNVTLIQDEIHNWLTKQRVIKEFNQVVLSGRPRGISVIAISSRPASLPNNILSNSKHVFAFKLNLESDVKFLETFLGSDVWMLMPPDKRSKHKDQPALPEHTFFYRNMHTDAGRFGKI